MLNIASERLRARQTSMITLVGGGQNSPLVLRSESTVETLLVYEPCSYILGYIADVFNRGLMPLQPILDGPGSY